MADDTLTATPESPTTRTFKIPIENAAPDTHVHQGRKFKIPVESKSFQIPVEGQQQKSSGPTEAELTANPVDPKTGKGEGLYSIKAFGKTIQVPFSKVPRVASIGPLTFYGKTTFANVDEERRYNKDFDALPVERQEELLHLSESYGPERAAQAARESTITPTHPEPEKKEVYEPTWWTLTKNAPGMLSDAMFGGNGQIPKLPGSEEIANSFLNEQLAKDNPAAKAVVGLQEVATKPRVNITGSKAFQSVFDPQSKNWFSRFSTHTVKAIENQTSAENLYTLGSLAVLPESIGKPVGVSYQAQLISSGVAGVAGATKASITGGEGDEGSAERWGDLLGNALVVVGMHYGGKAYAEAKDAYQNRDTAATLNEQAQSLYKQKFGKLTDEQKANVLYSSLEEADPKFKKRVDLEVQRLNAKKGTSKGRAAMAAQSKGGVDVAPPTPEEVQQQRLDAAKSLVRQLLVARARREAYQRAAMERETQARVDHDRQFYAGLSAEHAEAQRQAQDRATKEAAERAQSDEQLRGFPVEESRTAHNLPATGLWWTTERLSGEPGYNPEEPTEPAIPTVDRRAAAREPLPEPTSEVVAAESKVHELSEQRMGVSWNMLPLSRQVVAARWLERFHPEAWTAFRATPAYAEHQQRVQDAAMVDAALEHYLNRHSTGDGERQTVAPGADLQAATARLILSRTDITSVLKADPSTYRDLNQRTEQSMGVSWDALQESDRPAALAEYLRTKPEQLKAFLTPDLAERIRTGQHIELANIDAELANKQQASMLMEYRDQIQRTMNAHLADSLLAEATDRRQASFSRVLGEAQGADRSPSLQAVFDASQGLFQQGADLGLGKVDSIEDLFRVEKTVRETADNLRTPKMKEFMARLRAVRGLADDHVARTISEQVAESFRIDIEGAREKAAKATIWLSGMAHDLEDAADNLRAQGKPEQAQAAQDAAIDAKRKADAVLAGAESATNPPVLQAEPQPTIPMSVGGAARVTYPAGEKAAHYAVMEATQAHTSHLPMSYEPREGYNQNGQPRDYKNNKPAQAAVESRANQLDLDVLLSNDPQTVSGASVMDQRGHVISGNGRLLSILHAIINNPEQYTRYRDELARRAQSFGIDPAELAKYRNPVLVKVLDEPIKDELEWTRLGKEMNDDPTMGLGAAEQGVAMGRLLSPEFVDRLAEIIKSMPSVDDKGKPLTAREAMRERSADIAKLLVDAGIISKTKMKEFVSDDGGLTEKSKDLFENMLAGVTVTNPEVINRAPANVKDKLARVGIFFVRMRSAGENWNLASMNTDAVRLITRAQDAAARLSMLMSREEMEKVRKGNVDPNVTGSESLVEKYLHPERYFYSTQSLSFDGQSLHAPVHAGVEALAMALEEKPRDYATMMANYADRAKGVQGTIFDAENPADAFTNEIASKYGLKVAPEEWGSVVGLSDTVKAEIEDARGPLPVEPEVSHETAKDDVQPDSSSVTDVIPEGPKSVQELRKALATHPGVDEQQAADLTDIFENILPRAIGESLDSILGNRKLTIAVGGEEGRNRGYTQILEDGRAIIRLCNSAEPSTFLHEMAHYIRRYLKPSDQATANGFVGAKPGEEWTDEQEEKFAQAFERYHYDGALRKGKLEQAFGRIAKAMQSIYNAVTGRGLAQGSKELNAMFDNWYDWTRSERKPLTARIDVDQLVESANGPVQVPEGARTIAKGSRTPSANATVHVFPDEQTARAALDDKQKVISAWELLRVKGQEIVYARIDAKKGKKLFQPSLGELAARAKTLEDQLKKETDPRKQALLRGQLNGIEDKMGGGLILGGKPEPKDTSIIQLVHGLGERPSMAEPTTPAQAITEQQVNGDPTAISLGGERGEPRGVSDETPGTRGQEPTPEVHGGAGPANGKHGAKSGDGTPLAKPEKDPLAKVKAAKLKAPEVPRGTPVVDPGKWREHVEALGLPEGTPPPTVRMNPASRDLLFYPGQPEAVEGALSALQQYDATVVASPAGSGKTWLLSAVAEHLLGENSDKVGLLITKSQNLIHDAGGAIETMRKFGVDMDELPSDINEIRTGGMYAATYAGIRGNRDVLSIPWDFVLFDESGEAANWNDSEQGKAVVLLGHAAKKVVYSSATPYATVMELGYMHKLGLWPKGGFTEWAGQFGLKETGPNSFTGGNAPRKLEKLRQQIIERGQWQQLHKDLEGTEAHVVLIPQTPDVRENVRKIRSAFAQARAAFQAQGMSKYITPAAGHEVIYLKRYLSAVKLPHTIEFLKKAIAAGWNPVMFTEYRSPAEQGMEFFHKLEGGLGKKLNAMLPPLPDVVAEMRKAFGSDVGIFAGEANELRSEELEGFQGGDKKVLYMTFGAGGVGASAHDKVGDRPRIGVFNELPWGGKMLEQGTNRTDRYGRMSSVANVFVTSDAHPEIKLLATKVLPRMMALKAAVHGVTAETQLSKNLREAAGIPEELLQYEQGQEYKPQAADFEAEGDVPKFTHLEDFEMPDAKKAQNKPMKYKGQGRKLYQGPKDDEPLRDAVNDAWQELLRRTKDQSAPQERVVTANEHVAKSQAVELARNERRAGNDPGETIVRSLHDKEVEALLWWHELKGTGRDATKFLQDSAWMLGTSGDKVVEKAFKRAGMPEIGEEMKRRMIDWDLRKGLHMGRLQGEIRQIINGNKIKPKELELVSKIVEGQAESDDPRINKAVAEFRQFTAGVRKLLGDKGSVVVITKNNQTEKVPYSKIENDPSYWPRMYDWNKKFLLMDPKTGKPVVTSLAELSNMPTGDERRERFIEQFAKERNISKIQAQLFFEQHARGVRLAGNVERAREYEIPGYGRDRSALERYVDQVSTTLATTEVHGQFRERTDPLIEKLQGQYKDEGGLVNRIVTSDLDPAHLPNSARVALAGFNTLVISGKMLLSPLKVGWHLWKGSMATNTRSLAGAFLDTIQHPKDVINRAIDCNAMLDYSKSVWMREYGMKPGGVAQGVLDWNGFTFLVRFSRVLSSAAGRHWFEKYVYPELRKDPANPILRRKLTDLYGLSGAQIDDIAKNGYTADDVRRIELGAANWVTGSNRPSEMPPIFRARKDADLLEHHLIAMVRMTQALHGFMFKTANFVNRTLFEELAKSNWKSAEPYHLITRFAFNAGLAGFALEEIMHLRHQMTGSSEAEIEKRRHEWLLAHPASAESLWWGMANLSLAVGLQPATELFNELATHDPKDKEKMNEQHRVTKATVGLVTGIPGEDLTAILTAAEDYKATYEDTGRHTLPADVRRTNIKKRLLEELIPGTTMIPAIKPVKVPPRTGFPHKRRPHSVVQ